MRLTYVASLLLMAGLPLIAIPVTIAPDPTIAASPWEPIARVNPRKPYKVQINNQTVTELEYASTTSEFPPRKLRSGSTTTLNRLPLPIYLLISPVDPRYNLKYNVSANQNTVTVRVQQLPDDRPGNTTVNIQETGGIYVY